MYWSQCREMKYTDLSDPDSESEWLLPNIVILVALLNHSWPYVLLLASGFLNCSCFFIDSVQSGKASLQLACGFIDHQSLFSFHLPHLTHSVLEPGGGESTYFLLRMGWEFWQCVLSTNLHQGVCVPVFSNLTPCSLCIPVSESEDIGRREIFQIHQVPTELTSSENIQETTGTHLSSKFWVWGIPGHLKCGYGSGKRSERDPEKMLQRTDSPDSPMLSRAALVAPLLSCFLIWGQHMNLLPSTKAVPWKLAHLGREKFWRAKRSGHCHPALWMGRKENPVGPAWGRRECCSLGKQKQVFFVGYVHFLGGWFLSMFYNVFN